MRSYVIVYIYEILENSGTFLRGVCVLATGSGSDFMRSNAAVPTMVPESSGASLTLPFAHEVGC